jgi:hypothetical protein
MNRSSIRDMNRNNAKFLDFEIQIENLKYQLELEKEKPPKVVTVPS